MDRNRERVKYIYISFSYRKSIGPLLLHISAYRYRDDSLLLYDRPFDIYLSAEGFTSTSLTTDFHGGASGDHGWL